MIKIKFSNGLYMIWKADDIFFLRKTYRIVGNLIGTLPIHPRQNESQGLPLILMPEEVRLLQSRNLIQIVEQSFPDFDDSNLKEFNKNLRHSFKEDICKKYQRERQEQILSNLDKIVEGKLKKSNLILEEDELKHFREKTFEEMVSNIHIITDKYVQDRTRFYIESPYNEIKLEKKIELEPLEPFSLNSLKFLTFEYFWSKGYFLTSGLKFGAHFLAYDHDPLIFHAKFIIICCPKEEDILRFEKEMMQAFGRLGKNVRKNVILIHFNKENSNNKEEIQLKHVQWNPMVFNEEQKIL